MEMVLSHLAVGQQLCPTHMFAQRIAQCICRLEKNAHRQSVKRLQLLVENIDDMVLSRLAVGNNCVRHKHGCTTHCPMHLPIRERTPQTVQPQQLLGRTYPWTRVVAPCGCHTFARRYHVATRIVQCISRWEKRTPPISKKTTTFGRKC